MRSFAGHGAQDLVIPVVEGGKPMTSLRQPQDAIAPVSIVHDCDQAFDEAGELEYEYNHLVYTFDLGGLPIKARSYLDTIGEVSLLGIPDSMDLSAEGVQRVMHYLSRRYQVISRLSASGPVTLWQAGASRGEN